MVLCCVLCFCLERWLTDRLLPFDYRDAGMFPPFNLSYRQSLTLCRIVEYATPEQAQQAIASLTNKELQGRVVYVREVGIPESIRFYIRLTRRQDREQEPRFGGGGGAPRGGGGFAGPMGRGGGFQGGYGGGAPGGANAGRQLYISNVRHPNHNIPAT
jgi:hypothetical protein